MSDKFWIAAVAFVVGFGVALALTGATDSPICAPDYDMKEQARILREASSTMRDMRLQLEKCRQWSP